MISYRHADLWKRIEKNRYNAYIEKMLPMVREMTSGVDHFTPVLEERLEEAIWEKSSEEERQQYLNDTVKNDTVSDILGVS